MGRLDYIGDVEKVWARFRPEEDLSSLRVLQRLIWSGRLAEELMERAVVAKGLRHRGDYEVLALLRRSEPDPLTPAEVADQLRTSASGMTGKLDRLEGQGFLQRQSDPVDRRIVRLVLTEDGRVMVDEVFTSNLSMYRNMLQDLSPVEEETLHETLDKLLGRIDELSRTRYPWSTER